MGKPAGESSKLALCVVVLVALSGCNDAPVLLGGQEQVFPIVNGSAHSGHPAVGLLRMKSSSKAALCTATLVGSKTILTAAHCVVMDKGSPAHWPQMAFHVDGGAKHDVARSAHHPSYKVLSNGFMKADVAVLELATPVKGVKPLRVAPGSTYPGEGVRFVGFGRTGLKIKDSGTKRTAVNAVEKLVGDSFTVKGAQGAEGNICYGDSGSSVLATRNGEEVIVGVASALDVNKADNPSAYTSYSVRADQVYGWVEQTAQGDLYKGGPWDMSDPTVVIDSPTADAEVEPAFTVRATAKDDTGVKLVRALVDGSVVGQSSAAPFVFQVQGLAAGQHTIQVEATDTVGQTAAVTLPVTVKQPDAPPPPDEPPPPPGGNGDGDGNTPGSGGGRGYGEPCTMSRDCRSNLCALDPVSGTTFCTRACDLDTASCPGGTLCHPGSPETGSVSICGKLSSDADVVLLQGACSFAGTTPRSAWPLPPVLALLALLWLWRARGFRVFRAAKVRWIPK